MLKGRKLIRAKPQTIDGLKFDSAKEANRYLALRLLERNGEIFDLVVHPVFPLTVGGKPVLIRSKGYQNGRKAKYTADFSYIDRNGEKIYEDVKGYDTPIARLRRAVIEAEYGIRIDLT